MEELFNDLCATVCFKKPENIQQFLIEELENRQKSGSVMTSLLFEESEVEAVFRLSDLMKKGTITSAQARAAMAGIANTQAQCEMSMGLDFGTEDVDLGTFKAKVAEMFK